MERTSHFLVHAAYLHFAGSFSTLSDYGFCSFSGFGFFLSCSELLHSAGNVKQHILSGVERVAITANFNRHCLLCRADSKNVSAGAFYFRFRVILWVDILFHKGILAPLDFFIKLLYLVKVIKVLSLDCSLIFWTVRGGESRRSY